MACKTCRARKIKCDQTRPVCQNCQLRLSHCTYEGERRKRRWTDSGAASHGRSGSGSVGGAGSSGFGGDILFLGGDGQPGQAGQAGHEAAWSTATTTAWPAAAAAAAAGQRSETAPGSVGLGLGPGTGAYHSLRAAPPPGAATAPSPATSTSSTTGVGGGSMGRLGSFSPHGRLAVTAPVTASVTAPPPPPTSRGASDTLLDDILDSEPEEAAGPTRHPAIWIRTRDGDEFTGPSSGISVISDVGLEWLRERVPDSAVLCQTIQDIRSGLLGHLRQPKCIPRGLPVTPQAPRRLDHVPPAQVLRYVDAYFASVQIVFPILDRGVFLAQLDRYGTCGGACGSGGSGSGGGSGGGGGGGGSGGETTAEATRPSWLALLSAVLASGCRAALSDETAEAFQASGREAWAFFQDALFYERPMAHGATDLAAVQALAVMTVFAQGLSSPQRLEYTLCSLAVRQAQAIGLNYEPSPAWQLSADEQRERSRVFWAIYCLDKTVALRCGRPCVTCDAEISCRFPRGTQVSQPGGAAAGPGPGAGAGAAASSSSSTSPGAPPTAAAAAAAAAEHPESGLKPPAPSHTYDFFLCFVRLARICGAITRDLYSAAAVCAPASQLRPAMQRLLQRLEAWRATIPAAIQPGRPLGRLREAEGLSHVQVVILHSTYYYVLCAIYRRFSPLFTHHDDDGGAASSPRMPEAYVQAARSMVLLTKHLDTESFTPGWLVFYYPLTALTTIFVHVITNPSDVSSSNDIALMEAVVGLFGRLEYVTSGEAAFTKTAEFVRQARRVVDRWHAARAGGGAPSTESHPSDSEARHDGPGGRADATSPFDLLPMNTFLLSSPGQAMPPHAEAAADDETRPGPSPGGASGGQGRSADFGAGSLVDPLDGLLGPPPEALAAGDWLGAWPSASQVSAAGGLYF